MITQDYLLKKPARPSVPKMFLDTQIVPVAVNAAGAFEVALDRTARRLGVRPVVIVAVGLAGLGLAAASLAGWSGMRRRQRWTRVVEQPPLREIAPAPRDDGARMSGTGRTPQDHPDRSQGRSRADLAAERAPGPWTPDADLRARQERLLDEAIEETFPASDPIAPKRITR
ncbi:hypothetical protein [Methylobacterium sp. Leaf113]|uniref:hypothetical protein n=2 Tax=unclassified Methylobacterium TaxID=2615210 RepID=UPI000AFFB117|nr:hypothetical protein [Methylobacterium sp. Leaf113]